MDYHTTLQQVLPTSAAAKTNPLSSGKSTAALPPLNLGLLSLKSSSLAYTSLTDVLPAGALAGYEISIRNRLVKQAAWAYLQPMSASPSCSGHGYFHRLRCRFSGSTSSAPEAACLSFFNRYIFSAVNWVIHGMLRLIGVRTHR